MRRIRHHDNIYQCMCLRAKYRKAPFLTALATITLVDYSQNSHI